MNMKLFYQAYGSVRGACRHQHRTVEAAEACAHADQRGIRRAYPSTYPTHAYSDRGVRAIENGQPRDLTSDEVDALVAYLDEQ